MKKYIVYLPIQGYETYLVNAETEEEAMEMVANGDVDTYDVTYDWNEDALYAEEKL